VRVVEWRISTLATSTINIVLPISLTVGKLKPKVVSESKVVA
jgi:hypothetical protein